MMKKIGIGSLITIGLLVFIILIFIYASTKPDTFNIKRDIKINAKKDKIFLLLNDFRNWTQWSPYEKMDPNVKTTFSAITQGVGAIYTWSGNSAIGSGSMTIIQSNIPHFLKLELEMLAPFKASNSIEFILDQIEDITTVTWSMTGQNSYLSKIFNLFMDMDKMVGSQFEEGLMNLKTIAEK